MIMSKYHKSLIKKIVDVTLSSLCFLITLPLIVFISLASKFTSKGTIFFIQKRIGKDGKIFKIIKFRTMTPDAEKVKNKFVKLNEADGPVFKIHNDPRFTKFGKILSRTGLDELPQFINVLKGEMSMVGPRPLPVNEAKRLTKKQKIRELVKPGITSSWVIEGSHQMSFKKWMDLDAYYVKNATFATDIYIISKTFLMILRSILKL
jgi:lipopolysaccharide/colanic/teichoic acid biosynthesis glycosyltransferase